MPASLLEAAFADGTGGLGTVDDGDAFDLVFGLLLGDPAGQGGDAVVVGPEVVGL